MSKMSYIAYLCEQDDKETLIDELNMSGLTKITGKTVEEVADGFIKAYNNIRLQKTNPAFEKLNEIQTEMIKDATNKISAASIGIRNEDKEI
tara:strand:- start:11 stop:286 length:276 start_codon:yes stop_codon:yes gene_type:complete